MVAHEIGQGARKIFHSLNAFPSPYATAEPRGSAAKDRYASPLRDFKSQRRTRGVNTVGPAPHIGVFASKTTKICLPRSLWGNSDREHCWPGSRDTVRRDHAPYRAQFARLKLLLGRVRRRGSYRFRLSNPLRPGRRRFRFDTTSFLVSHHRQILLAAL